MNENGDQNEEMIVLKKANEDLTEQIKAIDAERRTEHELLQSAIADNRTLESKLRKARRQRWKSARVPTMLAVGFAVSASALSVATMHGMAVPGFGFFLSAAAAVGCALFCGITYERTRD